MTREQASLAESMEFYVEWFKIHPTRDVMELARVAEWERQGERDTRWKMAHEELLGEVARQTRALEAIAASLAALAGRKAEPLVDAQGLTREDWKLP